MTRLRMLTCLAVCMPGWLACAEQPRNVALTNEHVRTEFRLVDGVEPRLSLSRADGSDALSLTSDEFEILLLDDSRFTAKDYRAASCKRNATGDGSDRGLADCRPPRPGRPHTRSQISYQSLVLPNAGRE